MRQKALSKRRYGFIFDIQRRFLQAVRGGSAKSQRDFQSRPPGLLCDEAFGFVGGAAAPCRCNKLKKASRTHLLARNNITL
jgi:hypothetical protein